MKIVKFVLPVIAAGFVASSASAATSEWSVNANNIVAGTVANSLNVDGEGDDWTGAVLRVDLTSGSFYQNVSGGNAAPSSAFIGFVPELEFDTYVGIIDDSSAGIAGGAGDLGGGALSLDAPQFSATWFNTDTGDTGAALVANLTLTPDAAGTWELITSFAGGQLRSSGVVEGGALVPEPATLALMGLGGIAALRRR